MHSIVHLIPRFKPIIGGAEHDLYLWITNTPMFDHSVLTCFDRNFDWFSSSADQIPRRNHKYNVDGIDVIRLGILEHLTFYLDESMPSPLTFGSSLSSSSDLANILAAQYKLSLNDYASHAGLITLSYCGCEFLTLATVDFIRNTHKPLIFIPNVHQNRSATVRQTVNLACHIADIVICRTDAEAEFLARHVSLPYRKIKIIPVYRPASIALNKSLTEFDKSLDVVGLLHIGQLFRHKRIEQLINAVKICLEWGTHVQLTLIGPVVDAKYYTELQALGSGLPITFMGEVDDVGKWAAISAADVVLSASIQESFGGWILESWACGKCVVSALHPAAQCIIEDEVTGLLVLPNEYSIANAIIRLCNEPALRTRLGTNGKLRFLENYTDLTWTPHVAALFASFFIGPQP